MDKQNVKKFKNCQKRLAKKIAKTLGSNNFTIDYEQIIPSACIDRETGKVIVRNNTQYIFPTKTIRKGRNKLIVVMRFEGTCNLKKVGKILRRYFWLKTVEDGFEIRSSFNPCTIAKFAKF